MKTVHLVVLLMLLAGCAQQSPRAAPSQSAPIISNVTVNSTQNSTNIAATAPDCTQYCQNGTCQGSWNISGSYPDCVCGCVAEQKNTVASDNGPAPEPANMTISQLLDLGMRKLQSKFYSLNSGTFHVSTYTWSRVSADTDMNAISFDAAPPDDVKIDNKSLDSIVASGFIVFQGNYSTQSYGLLLAKGEQTVLDNYSTFSVYYFPPEIDTSLGDCSVYEKGYYVTADGDDFVSYSFFCLETTDK